MTGGLTGGLQRRRRQLGSSAVPLKPAAAGGTAAPNPDHQGTPATAMSERQVRKRITESMLSTLMAHREQDCIFNAKTQWKTVGIERKLIISKMS